MMSAISMIPDHFILPIKLDSLNSFPPYLVNIHLALPFDFFESLVLCCYCEVAGVSKTLPLLIN